MNHNNDNNKMSSQMKQPDLLTMIKQRVDYMDAPNPDGSPSPCALQCVAQQQAIADCVNQIRDDPDNAKTKECLKPACDAWVTCCTEANAFAGDDPTRSS